MLTDVAVGEGVEITGGKLPTYKFFHTSPPLHSRDQGIASSPGSTDKWCRREPPWYTSCFTESLYVNFMRGSYLLDWTTGLTKFDHNNSFFANIGKEFIEEDAYACICM